MVKQIVSLAKGIGPAKDRFAQRVVLCFLQRSYFKFMLIRAEVP